jgi:hypothetical protein
MGREVLNNHSSFTALPRLRFPLRHHRSRLLVLHSLRLALRCRLQALEMVLQTVHQDDHDSPSSRDGKINKIVLVLVKSFYYTEQIDTMTCFSCNSLVKLLQMYSDEAMSP